MTAGAHCCEAREAVALPRVVVQVNSDLDGHGLGQECLCVVYMKLRVIGLPRRQFAVPVVFLVWESQIERPRRTKLERDSVVAAHVHGEKVVEAGCSTGGNVVAEHDLVSVEGGVGEVCKMCRGGLEVKLTAVQYLLDDHRRRLGTNGGRVPSFSRARVVILAEFVDPIDPL